MCEALVGLEDVTDEGGRRDHGEDAGDRVEDGDQLLEAFERREVVRLEELLEVDGAVEQEQSLPGFGRLNHRVASNS